MRNRPLDGEPGRSVQGAPEDPLGRIDRTLRRLTAEEHTPLVVIGPRSRSDKARISRLGAITRLSDDALLIHGTSYPLAEGLRRLRLVERPQDQRAIEAARDAYHRALAQLDEAAATAWAHGRVVSGDDLEASLARVRDAVGLVRGDLRRRSPSAAMTHDARDRPPARATRVSHPRPARD